MIRPAAPLALTFYLLACAMVVGCAAPGEPTARHPIVPIAVTDLDARQYGSAFALTFTLPTRSLDREALAEHPSVEIYRSALPAGAAPDKKTEWRLAFTIPSEQVDSYLKTGRIEFHDPFTADDLVRPTGSSVAYKVRTRASKARASEDSNIVAARIYPAPEAPKDVKATVAEEAIKITWTDPSVGLSSRPAIAYRVYREEVEQPAPDQRNVEKAKARTPIALVAETDVPQFQFEDRNFEFGRSYVYSVRSVAQFGPEFVESADSPAVIVTALDVFPPAPPTGLEITVVPATPQVPAYVELSWAISLEADLAGYSVYRSDAEDAPGDRISTEVLPSPAFRDISVLPGKRYYYRVSALDRAGNESPKSPAVPADVP